MEKREYQGICVDNTSLNPASTRREHFTDEDINLIVNTVLTKF